MLCKKPRNQSAVASHTQKKGSCWFDVVLMCLWFRAAGCYGAILADEMGLGKTLQSVALSWTLLKQGPYGGRPVAKRVLVVTPGSLVQNWAAEFNKWLGRERISVFTVDQVILFYNYKFLVQLVMKQHDFIWKAKSIFLNVNSLL